MPRTAAAPDVSPSPTDATASAEFVPRRWLETLARAGGRWPQLAILCALLSTLVLLAQAWAIARLAQGVAIDREGLATLFDVLDAQRQLIGSRRSLIDSQAALATSFVSFHAAIGRMDSAP